MGRQLEQHRQRFIEQGNLVAFLAGYDEALHADVRATRAARRELDAYGRALLSIVTQQAIQKQEDEAAITPEELLAALEPTKAVAVEKREPTLDEAWNTLVNSFDSLWRSMIEPPSHALATIAILSGLMAIAIFLAQYLR